MDVTLQHIEDVADSIKVFWFKPDRAIRHVAGQFTQIHLPLELMDERGDKHWFTISSSPTEELIGITTKFTSNEGSAFKQALGRLQPGTKLTLAEPMGDFVLPKDTSIPLLFVAGGIGVTPYRSMIKWLNDTKEQRDVHLVYSVREPGELAFLDLFQSHDMTFTPIVTEPDVDWQGGTGLLSAERILASADADHRTLIYISGPEPMVEQFVKDLKQAGIPAHRLVTDYFPGYTKI